MLAQQRTITHAVIIVGHHITGLGRVHPWRRSINLCRRYESCPEHRDEEEDRNDHNQEPTSMCHWTAPWMWKSRPAHQPLPQSCGIVKG